jgi:hypothetical protein
MESKNARIGCAFLAKGRLDNCCYQAISLKCPAQGHGESNGDFSPIVRFGHMTGRISDKAEVDSRKEAYFFKRAGQFVTRMARDSSQFSPVTFNKKWRPSGVASQAAV